jgi:hypothetical protein
MDSAPSGRGLFEALGVYRPMTLVLRGANRARVMSRSGHFQAGVTFCFLPVATVFQREIWRQDRFRATIGNSVDLEHPPFGPAL